jgi:branched-chain amino acid transport system permease protein
VADTASAPLRVPPRYGPVREFLGVPPALVVFAIVALFVPRLASTYWTFNVMAGLVLAISCLGLLVLVGWARQISLMQAGLTGAGLYMCRATYGDPDFGAGRGWAFPVAVAWSVGFVVAMSFVTALVSVRLAGAYVIVSTVAVQFWLESSVMDGERFAAAISLPSTPRPDFFTLDMRPDARFYYLVLGCLLVVVVFLHRVRHSRFGRSMILAGADPLAAACVGVSPWRYRVWAFVVAGACAGLAGALSAPMYFSPPGTMQYVAMNSVCYLAVPVLAGFDSIAGTVAVAVALTLAPQLVLDWKLNVYLLGGLGMAVGCLLGPRGLARLMPHG